MVGYRLDFSRVQQLNSNSDVLSGAKLHVYANTTTTPVTLYSDYNGSVTAANPIVADSSGRFDVRYVGSTDRLTVTLVTSTDVPVWSNDNFEPVPNQSNSDLANYVARAGGNSNRMTGPLEFKEGDAIASGATVNLDAATGNFIHITGTTTITAVTLAQGSMRWVVFDGALTLTHSSNLILPNSLNIVTVAGDCALFVGEGSGVTRLLWYRCVDGKPLIETASLPFGVGDESTVITTGTAKITFRAPVALVLDAIPLASLTTASSSGNPAIDINVNGASIFSTVITIDATETTSATAATSAVLTSTPTTIAFNSVITVDIDTAGTNAAGLKGLLRGYIHNRT